MLPFLQWPWMKNTQGLCALDPALVSTHPLRPVRILLLPSLPSFPVVCGPPAPRCDAYRAVAAPYPNPPAGRAGGGTDPPPAHPARYWLAAGVTGVDAAGASSSPSSNSP